MKLVGRYTSPYVRRVAVTLLTYGMDFELEELLPFGDDKAEVRKFNPLGRIPALILDDGETIVESATIIDCLDDLAGPERALTPPSGPDRRRVLTLLAVASGATDKLVSSLYEHHLRPPEMVHRPWAKMCDRQTVDGFQWLEQQMLGDWFMGDRMTQADLTTAIFWQFGVEKRPNFFARMNCPKLTALSDRLAATEPFKATPQGEGLPKGIALE